MLYAPSATRSLLHPRQFVNVFGTIDKDGDDAISVDEFMSFCTTTRKQARLKHTSPLCAIMSVVPLLAWFEDVTEEGGEGEEGGEDGRTHRLCVQQSFPGDRTPDTEGSLIVVGLRLLSTPSAPVVAMEGQVAATAAAAAAAAAAEGMEGESVAELSAARNRGMVLLHAAAIAGEDEPIRQAESSVVVQVTVLSASNLRNADGMLGKSDPFVELTWRGLVVGRTATVNNDHSPSWTNEQFALPMGDTDNDLAELEREGALLEASVMDFDAVTASDLLGRVKVPVADVLRHARLRNSGPLGGTVLLLLDDVKGKQSGKSTLLLSFEFIRPGGGGGGEGGGVDKA